MRVVRRLFHFQNNERKRQWKENEIYNTYLHTLRVHVLGKSLPKYILSIKLKKTKKRAPAQKKHKEWIIVCCSTGILKNIDIYMGYYLPKSFVVEKYENVVQQQHAMKLDS